MSLNFNYIRNKIRQYETNDLLDFCYNYIQLQNERSFPIWPIFTLMKWSYLHGGYNINLKKLNNENFLKLLNLTFELNNDHVSNFLKTNIHRGFYILASQQFYLQKNVSLQVFATQLKLYSSLKGKYDIEKSFLEKTGLSIFDFLYLQQITWLYVNVDNTSNTFKYEGHLTKEFIDVLIQMTNLNKVNSFLNLLILNPTTTIESIEKYKRRIILEDLQSLETTFFTIYPFQFFNNQIKVIHKSVYNHFANYYIYDFMKSNDSDFTTEFGYRFERYIGSSLTEIKYNFKDENSIKKLLPKNSNLVDFYVDPYNIFIECKAIEIQAYTSINPTDELLYNSLKDSILKAYFKQFLNVAKSMSPDTENWGIILTYKELFWSSFDELFEIGKDKFSNSKDYKFLPPENVFIIDIYSWNTIIEIIKDKKATLLDILKVAKSNNSSPKTKKQLFNMHLNIYNLEISSSFFLQEEIELLKIK
ncbi:hypothetical protein [Flavobacterium sp. MMS24-S5]|uniref:hypothetical protein n=1 Tax=Flavobacterium sp. MMS24-S5 TaxID=3416605 RepID=UPI003D061643